VSVLDKGLGRSCGACTVLAMVLKVDVVRVESAIVNIEFQSRNGCVSRQEHV